MKRRIDWRRLRWDRILLLLLELALLVGAIIGAAYLLRRGADAYEKSAYPMDYASLIDAACKEKKLDRALVYAVVRTESGFRPEVQSHVGARGLMQMMPDAYDWVRQRMGRDPDPHYDNLYDPETNITHGTDMLRLLFDRFEYVENVLCAYHAGYGRAEKWLADAQYAPDGARITVIPFDDTRAYVTKVMETKAIYEKLYGL